MAGGGGEAVSGEGCRERGRSTLRLLVEDAVRQLQRFPGVLHLAVELRLADAGEYVLVDRPLGHATALEVMAGGAGVEYYFGYALPENDLVAQDFRSRDQSWDYCRIALEFFRAEKIPFWEMASANALLGNAKDDNSKFCLAKPGELYLVYLPSGGTTDLDLSGAQGAFSVNWFNPRAGGKLINGPVGIS